MAFSNGLSADMYIEMQGKRGWRGLGQEAVQAILQRLKGNVGESDLKELNSALWRLGYQRKPELMVQAAVECGHLPLQEGHYTALMDGLLCAQRATQAASVFYHTRLFNVPLDCAILSDLLAGLLLSDPRSDNIEWVWDRIAEESMTPPANLCAKLLLACIEKAQWVLARKVLSAVLQHDLELPWKQVQSRLPTASDREGFVEFEQLWKEVEDTRERNPPKGLRFVLVFPRKLT